MNNLIMKEGEYDIKESIQICCKEQYKKVLKDGNFIILDLQNIVIEYLDTKASFEVIFEDFIIKRFNTLFSIDKIEEGTKLKITNLSDEINLININTNIAKLRKNVVLTEWMKNYDYIECKTFEECISYIISNNNDKIPFTKKEYTNTSIPRLEDIAIIEETKEEIQLLANQSQIFSGPVISPIYFSLSSTPFAYIEVKGKIIVKECFLRGKMRNNVCKKVVYDGENKLLYSGGRVILDNENRIDSIKDTQKNDLKIRVNEGAILLNINNAVVDDDREEFYV